MERRFIQLLSIVQMVSILMLNSFAVSGQTDTTKGHIPTLEELLNAKVVSPSNFEEKLGSAPATVVIITQQDFQDRGYTDASEIFDDLPGMDIIRTYGDTYFTNYFRGFRYTIGSPYLVMIDGVVMNSLYFGVTTDIAAIPISNIDQVEVVYGPASSVYGANALLGVVNIITKKDAEEDGSSAYVRTTASANDDLYSDFNVFFKKGDLRLSVSGHIENGNLRNRLNNNNFYWTQDSWYADTLLWGDLTNNSNLIPQQFSSPIRNRGVDVRAFFGNTEVAYTYTLMNNGYGTIYPGDRIPASMVWPRFGHSAHVRHIAKLGEKVSSRSLVRWRSEGVRGDAFDIEGYNRTNSDTAAQMIGGISVPAGESARMLHMTYWQSMNYSLSLFQDFEIKLSDKFRLLTGLKYEYKNLQKAYETSTSMFAPSVVDASDPGTFPAPSSGMIQAQNRVYWRDQGVYLQSKYYLSEDHLLNFGMRLDDNNVYGSQLTFRGGYVGLFGKITTKLLYGESFQEPVPRSLYGGWTGSGSDPMLLPENSRTIEVSFAHSLKHISNMVNAYYVLNHNNVINFSGGAKNAGNNKVIGLDYHFRGVLPVSFMDRLEFWAYYSVILEQEEEKFDDEGQSIGTGIIGDLAETKVYFGMTGRLNDHLTTTIRGRYIGDRETVDSNPLGSIDGYTTIDMNIMYRNLFVDGLSFGVKLNNILDAQYYHPGIRDANSGDPMQNGELLNGIGWTNQHWSGSQGWYNSRLPQPGRMVLFSLVLDY